MHNLSTPRTLSDRQLAWCRQHIRSFADACDAVQKADAHRREVYEKLGVTPGTALGAAQL
jgi:hypothetical protein